MSQGQMGETLVSSMVINFHIITTQLCGMCKYNKYMIIVFHMRTTFIYKIWIMSSQTFSEKGLVFFCVCDCVCVVFFSISSQYSACVWVS